MIKKYPWKFEGHVYFSAGRWSAGTTYDDAGREVAEVQYLPTVPVPVHRMESFYNSAAEPDRELLKLPLSANTRLCTGKIGEPTTEEKMDRSSCVGVGKESKDPGQHSYA